MVDALVHVQCFFESLKGKGRRVCIIEEEASYTYDDLVNEVSTLRDQCRSLGLKKGEVVGILGDFSFDSVALFFALALESIIIAPLGKLGDVECGRRIKEAHIRYCATASNGLINLDKVYPEQGGHPLFSQLNGASGLILFSSGTTGVPKVMLHDLDRMLGQYSMRPLRDYRVLLFLFFDHIGGLDTLFRSLMNGSALVVASHRKPEVLAQLVERFKIDVLPMTPTALNLMLLSESYEKYDMSSLKVISYGAEPMPEWLLKRLHELFPSVQLQQKFGVSEMHVLRVRSKSSDSLEMKIEDEHSAYKVVDGELFLKTDCPIVGYLNMESSPFDEEGWFHTGDVVELAGDGYMKIKGRKSEVINVGGEKVLPVDVETVLLEMPEVDDCCVRAAKNGLMGQVVEAEIVLSEISKGKDIRKVIRSYCKERLQPFAVPVYVRFVNSLKRSKRLKKIRTN